MIWRDIRQAHNKQRSRPMVHALIVVILLSVLTCAEMLAYDAICSRIRHFKMYSYTMIFWIVPIVGAAAVSGLLQTFPIRCNLVAFLLAQLAVVLHEVVVNHIWSVTSLNVQLFVRLALIQSVLKLLTILVASCNLRTGSEITLICCMTGIFFATMYCVIPVLLSRFYTLNWGYIADSALFQILNIFLGLIAGFFIFVFRRPLGLLVSLAFDAPLMGTYAWLSYSTEHLTTLYKSLVILGTMLFALGMYFAVVRRKAQLCESHLPLETRGSVLIISMTLPLRCKGKPSLSSIGLVTFLVILFWAPIMFFAYKSEDGDVFRKCIMKIILVQLFVPTCAFAFYITRPSAITFVTGTCIGIARLLVSLSTFPAVMAFLETFGSFGRFTDISVHSRAGVVFFQLCMESMWLYSFILLGFLPNFFVAHCGVDWVFVGAVAGAFVAVFETVGSHGGLTQWTLHLLSTFVFTHCVGMMTGAYFALCAAKILGSGFYMCILIVPWMTLLFALMIRYLLGFWGTFVAPLIVGVWAVVLLAPIYRVRGE